MLTWTERANLVQHIGGLVNPTAMVPGAGKDLLDRLPEAERAVADREVGCDLKTTPPDVDEEFAPALRALPHPVWKPTSSFLPSGVAPISASMHSALSSIRACR
jgi:hypothetical protein